MYEKIVISHDTLKEIGMALYEAQESKGYPGYKEVRIPIDAFNLLYEACCASHPASVNG